MNYEADLKGIDDKIERDYERLVAERYLPVFSNIVKECADVLSEGNIPAIKLGLTGRLNFLRTGEFMYDKNCIFPKRTGEDNLNRLLYIAKIYRESFAYSCSVQTALKKCLDNLVIGVKRVAAGDIDNF